MENPAAGPVALQATVNLCMIVVLLLHDRRATEAAINPLRHTNAQARTPAQNFPEHFTVARHDARGFEHRADLVLVVDCDERLLYTSDRWPEIFGAPSHEVLGLPVLEAIGKANLKTAHMKAFELALASGLGDDARLAIPLHYCDDANDSHYLEGRVYGPCSGSGNLVIVFHEDTARVTQTWDLYERERRFRMVATAARDMVTETNAAGVFTYVSPACSDVLGYTEMELLGRSPLDLHHPEDLATFVATLKRHPYPGHPFSVAPHRLKCRDGSWVWVEATGVRFRRQDGEIRVIGVASEITARLEADDIRRQLEDQVRRAQKLESLGILASGIAHDFNNLMTPIVGTASLLSLEISERSPLQRHIETIRKAAQRATDLTAQMLTYAGERDPQLTRVDISETIDEMQLLLDASVRNGAALEICLDPNLPRVWADRVQISQVIMNLVGNAAEALGTEPGNIRLSTESIEVDHKFLEACDLGAKRAPGPYVCMQVKDDGIGIDDATRERIFDPFFSTKQSNRGLGLAVVLGIVNQHAGALKIESEPRRGTCFSVLLPVATDA